MIETRWLLKSGCGHSWARGHRARCDATYNRSISALSPLWNTGIPVQPDLGQKIDRTTYYNLKHIGGCARRTGERRQSLVMPTVKLLVHLVPCFAYAGKVPWRFPDMIGFKRAFKIKKTQSKLLLRYESNSGGGSFWSSSRNRNHHWESRKIAVSYTHLTLPTSHNV